LIFGEGFLEGVASSYWANPIFGCDGINLEIPISMKTFDAFCPTCASVKQTPAVYVGREVSCENCGATFTAQPQVGSIKKVAQPQVGSIRKVGGASGQKPESGKKSESGITYFQGSLIIYLMLLALGSDGIGLFAYLKNPVPKWEYRKISIVAEIPKEFEKALGTSSNALELAPKVIPDFSDELETAGILGWELVGVFLQQETAHPNFGEDQSLVTGLQPNIRPQNLVCIFKRPANEKLF